MTMTQTHYQPQSQPQHSGSSSSSSSFTCLKKYASLHDEFVQHWKEEDVGKTNNEVDRYLTKDVEPIIEGDNYDILIWWVGNASKYKILSTIAPDILAI